MSDKEEKIMAATSKTATTEKNKKSHRIMINRSEKNIATQR